MNENTYTTAFEYDALGTSMIVIIHLAVILPIIAYMIASLYRKVSIFLESSSLLTFVFRKLDSPGQTFVKIKRQLFSGNEFLPK